MKTRLLLSIVVSGFALAAFAGCASNKTGETAKACCTKCGDSCKCGGKGACCAKS